MLPGEDVEVIEPEVGHHLLELPPREHRAHQLGLRELGDRVPLQRSIAHRFLRLATVGRRRRVFDHRGSLAHLALLHELLHQCVGTFPEQVESLKLLLEQSVVEALRVQLLLDEGGNPHALRPQPIFRPRTERSALEDVLDHLRGSQRRRTRGGCLLRRRFRRLRGERRCDVLARRMRASQHQGAEQGGTRHRHPRHDGRLAGEIQSRSIRRARPSAREASSTLRASATPR